ncbi:di-heme-cytochrome C peroxidase [Paracoccus beibuensis]|uniref:di-heme-cytochrome C peroxidase n=1 Tax=Paracoccus beibuensis TaxID=547602 RepID=UPI00223E96FC|nr:di-heme-cytochrome C peroxidase [Paracoccus beibuensis]
MTVRTVFSALLLLALGGCFLQRDTADDQGWSANNRKSWYFATQGSRLMPATWFRAVTLPGGSDFAAADNLARYGFLPAPDGYDRDLPIGFTQDRQDDEPLRVTKLRWYADQQGGTESEPWIGLNCAACHTASMTHDGKAHLIDGGPALIDFQTFVEDLDMALADTRGDPARWEAFAARVLNGRDTPENREMLAAAYDRLLDWQRRTAQMNQTGLRYGAGRLDAVGHILNKVLLFAGADGSAGNAPNAPVSFPHLWDITRQERVQWNGLARNSRFALPGDDFEYGALGRNTGEVLGVFGEVIVTPQPAAAGALIRYASSVRAENLVRMELILSDLRAPDWPADFPPIDRALRDQGEALFVSRHCADCHRPPAAQKPGRPTEVMLPLSKTGPVDLTDIWMACNAFVYQGDTGPMEGVRDNDGQPMGPRAPVAGMLATAVRGALVGQGAELVKAGFNNFFGIRPRPSFEVAPTEPGAFRAADRQACLETQDEEILAYKARPLDGVWATAPYLHNGSVASLEQLLLPADRRKTQFWVGNREFDPVEVGYVDADPGDGRGFLLRTRDESGQVIEGNSNAGHDYGVGSLTDAERRALIEYMKSL